MYGLTVSNATVKCRYNVNETFKPTDRQDGGYKYLVFTSIGLSVNSHLVHFHFRYDTKERFASFFGYYAGTDP